MQSAEEIKELILLNIGELCCGINNVQVQEINKHIKLTMVPHAPEYIRGVMNLRGQIMTIIDLRSKFDLPQEEISAAHRVVVVHYHGEMIGLLADSVSDIINIKPDNLEPPPPSLGRINAQFFSAIYKMEDKLIAVLDLEKLLAV